MGYHSSLGPPELALHQKEHKTLCSWEQGPGVTSASEQRAQALTRDNEPTEQQSRPALSGQLAEPGELLARSYCPSPVTETALKVAKQTSADELVRVGIWPHSSPIYHSLTHK